MNIFSYLYTAILWKPLFNGLVGLYVTLPGHDLGLAIAGLTILIRIILMPLLSRAQESQRTMQVLQPKVKKIQETMKSDREGQGRALMALYAEHNVNPFFAFLAMAVQLPILIALFQVFREGLRPESLQYLYSFVPHPALLNPISFGLLNLTHGNLYLGVLAAITQYLQTKLVTPPVAPDAGKNDFATMLQWQTTYIFPGLILVWSYTLPSALTLYWTVMNTFGIVQELLARKKRARSSGNSAVR